MNKSIDPATMALAYWQQSAAVARFVAHELGNQQVSQKYLQAIAAQSADKLQQLIAALRAQGDALSIEQVASALVVLQGNYVQKNATQAQETAELAQALLDLQQFFASQSEPMSLQRVSLRDALVDVLSIYTLKAQRAGYALQVSAFPDVVLHTLPAFLARGLMIVLQLAVGKHGGGRCEPPEPIQLDFQVDESASMLVVKCGFLKVVAGQQSTDQNADLHWFEHWLLQVGGGLVCHDNLGHSGYEFTLPINLQW